MSIVHLNFSLCLTHLTKIFIPPPPKKKKVNKSQLLYVLSRSPLTQKKKKKRKNAKIKTLSIILILRVSRQVCHWSLFNKCLSNEVIHNFIQQLMNLFILTIKCTSNGMFFSIITQSLTVSHLISHNMSVSQHQQSNKTTTKTLKAVSRP